MSFTDWAESDTAPWIPVNGNFLKLTHPTTAISGTSHNLDADDALKYLRFTNSSAKTLNVQPNATEAIDVDTEFHGRNANTGDLTIDEGSGVTVNAPADGTLVVPPQGTFTLKKVATNEWDLFGVTVPA